MESQISYTDQQCEKCINSDIHIPNREHKNMLAYQLNVDEVFSVINVLFKLKEVKIDQAPLTPIAVLLYVTRFKTCW